MHLFVLALLLLLPTVSHAAVVISEVAWMGSTASANHEWIELYNDGADVDIDGWTMTDGMNLNIVLTGTIPANTYAVLERTSDDSANGGAFLIYTGALVNTGATLQLKRSDGGLEDQVAGGENWQNIGGDNLTKETAQYTTAGWVTGAATPGATNSGISKDVDEEEEEDEGDNEEGTDTESSTPKLKVSAGEAVRLVLPDVSLKLIVGAQKLGYVHQPISFEVTPSGVGDTLIDSLSYEWNFGDGTTAYAKEPIHSYEYPGTYVVTVYGGYKRQEQVARHEITILPVSVSLTTSSRGDLQINNESPYEIDISGYQVNGGKEFVFPPRSVMLPNQTITLAAAKVGDVRKVVVRDVADVVVTTKEKSKIVDTPTLSTPKEKQVLVQAVKQEERTSEWFAPLLPPMSDSLAAALASYLTPSTAEAAPNTIKSTTTRSKVPDNAWPYIGFIIVIIIGLMGTAKKMVADKDTDPN